MNLTASNEEVDAKLAEMKAPYTEDQFTEKLKASNHTLEDVKHDIRRTLTINKLLSKEIDSKITVTDADVTNYYNAHKSERFNLLETQYHLAQIQVTGVPSEQPGNLQNSKAMNDAPGQEEDSGAPEPARQRRRLCCARDEHFRTSRYLFQWWRYRFVSDSQMKSDPAIYATITKLKPGQVTEIVPVLDAQSRRPVGYAIYKLISREPAGQRELKRPSCSAGDPSAASRWTFATSQERLLRDAARSGQGGKLLRRTDLQERNPLVAGLLGDGVIGAARGGIRVNLDVPPTTSTTQ